MLFTIRSGAKKLAFEDRIRHLEDPAFGDPKIAMLISKDHAAKRRELLADTARRPQTAAARWEGIPPIYAPPIGEGNAISLDSECLRFFRVPGHRR